MKRFFQVVYFCAFLLFAWFQYGVCGVSWEGLEAGHDQVLSVLLDRGNEAVIFVGSSGGLFRSLDYGRSWRSVLSVRGGSRRVNYLAQAEEPESGLYAATGAGLYYSSDKGKSWRRIFRGRNSRESECRTLADWKKKIYLGTLGGLFISDDSGRSWHKAKGRPGNESIVSIAVCSKEAGLVYAASESTLYKSKDAGESWERIFLFPRGRSCVEQDGGDSESCEEGEESAARISYITFDPRNESQIYLASSRGVYYSGDKGSNWVLFNGYGLLSQRVHFLLFGAQEGFFCLSESGIFEYRNQRWQEISLELAAGRVNFLAINSRGVLYAACEKGLFKSAARSLALNKADSFLTRHGAEEPQIREVQLAAIKYAEVEPEKIMLWRRQAAKKALLPRLTIGIDRDTSDLWHWESGSTVRVFDDNLIKGKDALGWDVTLSWDLGELIWNNDQTSIDTRSRLMVELREDILDEVTKIYFERIRVKREINYLPIEDRKKREERQIRLQELTAYLDGLTGGYFSRQAGGSGS